MCACSNLIKVRSCNISRNLRQKVAVSLFLIYGSSVRQVDLVPLHFTLSASLIKFILSLDAYPSFIFLQISADVGRIQGKMVSGDYMRSPLCF